MTRHAGARRRSRPRPGRAFARGAARPAPLRLSPRPHDSLSCHPAHLAAQRSSAAVTPAIAQLVEHLTVDFAGIRGSLVRFRVAGLSADCSLRDKQFSELLTSRHGTAGEAIAGSAESPENTWRAPRIPFASPPAERGRHHACRAARACTVGAGELAELLRPRVKARPRGAPGAQGTMKQQLHG